MGYSECMFFFKIVFNYMLNVVALSLICTAVLELFYHNFDMVQRRSLHVVGRVLRVLCISSIGPRFFNSLQFCNDASCLLNKPARSTSQMMCNPFIHCFHDN